MYYRKPDYYDEFKCIADKCPESCCSGWGIVIDDKTMAKYNKLPKNEREYVLEHIDVSEGMYKRCDGRCSFLNEDNLCDLYINLGEDKFCRTCRVYPRHFEEYGNLLEAAMSLSCPEVARIILTNKRHDKFVVNKNEVQSPHKNEVDQVLLANLLGVRKHIFSIISDDSMPIDLRLKRAIIYAEKIQKLVYDYEKLGRRVKNKQIAVKFALSIDMITKKELSFAQNIDVANKRYYCSERNAAGRYDYMPQIFDMLLGMENINEKWPAKVEAVMKFLYSEVDREKYILEYGKFAEYMRDREIEYEHIAVYFIYTYFLGGVYDYNILAMVRFAVLSTVIVREMGFYAWLTSNKEFSVDEQIKLAVMYSRQIEHSDDNLMAIEGLLNAHPIFDTVFKKIV